MQVEASLCQLIPLEKENRKKQRKEKVVAKAGTEDVGELTCGEALTVKRNIPFHKFQTMKL